jgi:hypothetical protein
MGTFGLEDGGVKENFMPVEKETVLEVLRQKEVISREFSEEASPYIRGILSCPLVVDGKVAGVLTLFNRLESGTLSPRGFSMTDVEVISRFIIYVQKSLCNVMDEIKAGVAGVGGSPEPLASVGAYSTFSQ